MSPRAWLNNEIVWAEVTQGRLRVDRSGRSREWALERASTGEWTPACRAILAREVPEFLERKPWQPKGEVRCALPAAGVTLRRWKIPRATPEESRRVLALQIESELPLPADELAWAWTRLGEMGGMQEIVVAVLRRRAMAEIQELLEGCGVTPKFTLSALARASALESRPVRPGGETWLHVGSDQSEFLVLDEAGPCRLRMLPWGESSIVHLWMSRMGVTEEAARTTFERAVGASSHGDEGDTIRWEMAARDLAEHVSSPVPRGQVYLTGRLSGVSTFRSLLASSLEADRHAIDSEPRKYEGGPVMSSGQSTGAGAGAGDPNATRVVPAETGSSDAIRAMQRIMESGRGEEGLWLLTSSEESPAVLARPAPRRWAIRAAALLLASLSVPYLEAWTRHPGLSSRVAAVRSRQKTLETIDRQLDFLKYLEVNQTPYMEALIVLGKTLPPGSKMESLALNRKGEMALRLTMRQPQEVSGFRSKLTDTGFFSSVVIEDQTPSPDRQKVQVRISAQLQPYAKRQRLEVLSAAESGSAKPESAPGPKPPGRPPAPAGARS